MTRRTAAAVLGILLVVTGPGVNALAQVPTEAIHDPALPHAAETPDATQGSTVDPAQQSTDSVAVPEPAQQLLGSNSETELTAPEVPDPEPVATDEPTAPVATDMHPEPIAESLSNAAPRPQSAPIAAMAAAAPAPGVCTPLTGTELFRLLPVADSYSRSDLHFDTIAEGVLGNDAFEYDLFTFRGEELAQYSGIQIELVSGPSHAISFSLDSDGRFSYLPLTDYYGVDQFDYRLRYTPAAGSPTFWCSESVTVTIQAEGHVPQDDSYSVQNDAVLDTNAGIVVCSGFYCGVLRNDRNLPKYPEPLATVASATAGGVTRTVAELTAGNTLRLTRGTLQSLEEYGHFRYVPDAGASGSDGFSYTLAGSNRSANVHITVHDSQPTGPVGDPLGDTLRVEEDQTLTLSPSKLLENDPGARYITQINGGQPFSLRTERGTLALEWRSVQENEMFITVLWGLQYTSDPIPGTIGALDSFTYRVSGSLQSAFVLIGIKNVQRPPVGHDDAATVYQGQTLTLDVIANDTDADGDIDRSTARLAPCSEACPGTWSMTRGVLSYQPDPGFTGTVTRKYTVQDQVAEGDEDQLGSTEATIRLTVLPAPAVNDHFETDEDEVLTGNFAENDAREAFAGIEGARVEIADQPAHGEVILSGDQGAFTYEPEPNFFGTDSFRYRWVHASTGKVLAQAVVSVTISAVNDPPELSVVELCLAGVECPDGEVRDVTVGQAVTVSGSLSDPDGDSGVLTIDWNDGTVTTYPYMCDTGHCTVEGASAPSGSLNVFSATHVYQSVGPDPLRPIQIRAADAHGASANASTAARVLPAPGPDPEGPVDPVDQDNPDDDLLAPPGPGQHGTGGYPPAPLTEHTAEGALARTGDSQTGGAVAVLVSLSALAILSGAALWRQSTRRERA